MGEVARYKTFKVKTKIAILILVCCWTLGVVWAGNDVARQQIYIKRTAEPIVLDGQLNEPAWQRADIAADFYQNFPYDTAFARIRTEVKVTYDDKNFYIGATCFDTAYFVVQSLKRDFALNQSDFFGAHVDPFNDQTNGFTFAVNPLGVQVEGLITGGGGGFGDNFDWDNKWFSKVQAKNDRWIVEMAIPFKTLRYNNETPVWGINFSRNNLSRNERSSWVPIPRNFDVSTLAFTGDIVWDAPPAKAGGNVSVIPYTIANMNQEFEPNSPATYGGNAGLDAKVAVSSSLNLDVTVNPDFSQVEVDRQVTNLTRFSLFFPERRNFFIENSDLFSQWGFRQIRPFFSRRIGLADGTPVPILGGARLSGKLNQNLRIGLLNMQTEGMGELSLNSQNYTVGVFQQQVLGRSHIGGIFVNRQSFQGGNPEYDDYNRILGMDFNLFTRDNKLRGKVFYHHSFNTESDRDNYAHASWLLYSTKKLFWMWNHEYVGANYIADVGFVPRIHNYNSETDEIVRLAYWRYEPILNYKFFPRSDWLVSHGPDLYSSIYFDKDYRYSEWQHRFKYLFVMQNTSNFEVFYNNWYVRLIFPVDITRTDREPLPSGDYYFNNAGMSFASDKRRIYHAFATINYGEFYNGTKLSYNVSLKYRRQPWGIFSIDFSRDEVRLPQPYGHTFLTLVGPKFEFSFTKSIFLTTFIQYNTQIENININSRLQWRFKPMSDLFIVYTDNYYPVDLRKKSRALVVKFNYWFTL